MRTTDLLSPEGLRIDGRRANELRRISCEMGVDKDANGSALVQIGQTQVMALVYGPHDSKGKGTHDAVCVNAIFKVSPYATADRKYRPKHDRRLAEMGIYLKQAFEQVIITNLYPRSQIDIHIHVLQTDGGTMHASINAATLALVDAGIPMYDYLCSCSAGFVEETSIIDLSQFEESAAYDIPKFTVAVIPNSGKVVLLNLESRMPFSKFELVRDLAVSGARQIRHVLDQVVKEHANKSLATRVNTK